MNSKNQNNEISNQAYFIKKLFIYILALALD